MNYEISSKANLTPEQREVLDIWNIKYSLKAIDLELEDTVLYNNV